MKKSVWLIDADMTLFDFQKAEAVALRTACGRFGIEVGEAERQLYHRINDALWKQLERGEVTQARLRVQRFEQFAQALGLDVPPDALNRAYARELGEGCYLFPQALSLLQGLHRRCTVCILTNGITEVQTRRFQLSGLRPYVDALVISQQEGFSKPDPRIVERALQRVGCADKSQAVIVGDSLTSDMLAAKNAQVDGIWYNPAGLPDPGDNPYIRAQVRQLHDLFQFV